MASKRWQLYDSVKLDISLAKNPHTLSGTHTLALAIVHTNNNIDGPSSCQMAAPKPMALAYQRGKCTAINRYTWQLYLIVHSI